MDNYIARQPIYSANRSLHGYELLYRDDVSNAYPAGMNGDAATRRVLSNTLFSFDLHTLTNGRMAFVNFTRQLLLNEIPLLLNPDHFTVEVLEDVALDAPILEALKKYKDAGFTVVLDDYTGNPIPPDFLPLMDIIKVDFRGTDREAQMRIARTIRQQGGITLLAEKVEDEEDFTTASASGYTLFQGYYFSAPKVLKTNALSIATFTYARLMRELSHPNMDFRNLAEIIYPDAELTWLLMKKMRTILYYRGNTVSSIQLALARMGIDEVRRWATLLLLQKVLGNEMDELIRIGLIRAVFCECLSTSMSPELQRVAFATGLFSILASTDDSFYQSLDELGMGAPLKEALKEGNNPLGSCLKLIRAYETGDWANVSLTLQRHFPNLSSDDLVAMYMEAVDYADKALFRK